MRKFLRILLILILLLIVVVVVAGLLAPKETNISVSNTINAPKEQVWEQIVKFKNWPNWSPWIKMEPDVALTYSGTDGEPGSSYHWVGKETGEGNMSNTGVENGQMNYGLHFVKPFEGDADGYLKVEDSAGMSKVTWAFHSQDGFIMRGLSSLMGMNKMLTQQFNDGLKNMKEYVESHKMEAAAPAALSVQETQFTARAYTCYRSKVAMQDFDKVFGDAMGKLGSRIAGAPVAIIYNWDTVKMEADAFMGAPVSEGDAIKGATVLNVPASRAYLVAYTGNPAGTKAAHELINAKLAEKKEAPSLMLEEFVRMAPEEKDMSKWVTNVYYLVK